QIRSCSELSASRFSIRQNAAKPSPTLRRWVLAWFRVLWCSDTMPQVMVEEVTSTGMLQLTKRTTPVPSSYRQRIHPLVGGRDWSMVLCRSNGSALKGKG